VTIFLGCGFAAKYREGGGNFSVPLQWILGLRRLKQDAIWLELLPATKDPRADQVRIDNFQRQLRAHGLADRYCLLYQKRASDMHDLSSIRCIGMSKRALLDRMSRPNALLNLSYSIHPPLLLQFEKKIFCDLDPSEIFYWMTKMEMGQSYHDEFWTIGLNVYAADCKLPKTVVAAVPAAFSTSQATRLPLQKLRWKTFYPLADTKLLQRQPRPPIPKFTTIGQWYWSGAVEVNGEFPDLSKKFAFERYLDLPQRILGARFELAMNIKPDDPERARLKNRGWHVVDPHQVARSPKLYRRYMTGALAEFTAIKGVDVAWRTGWVSDRAAAFLALGRPVITEDTAAGKYLLPESGFRFVGSIGEAETAVKEVLRDWPRVSKQARACAVEVFDSAKNLRKILDF
jgi:hypothetical protein